MAPLLGLGFVAWTLTLPHKYVPDARRLDYFEIRSMKAVRATRGVVFRKSDAGQRLALARNKYILSRAIKPPFLFSVMAVAETGETAE